MRPPWLLHLALREVRRHPFRNLLLAVMVAVVAGLEVGATLLASLAGESFFRSQARLGPDLVALPVGLSEEVTRKFLAGEPEFFYMRADLVQKIAGFKFVERVSAQVFFQLPLSGKESSEKILVVAFDPATDFTLLSWLPAKDQHQLRGNEVLLGAKLAAEEVSELGHRGVKVAGQLLLTGSGLDRAVFVRREDLPQIFPELAEIAKGKISAVMIQLKPEKAGGLPAYRAAFELMNAMAEITALEPSEPFLRVRADLTSAWRRLRGLGLALWLATALLLGLVFSAAFHERERELGLLRALGASRIFLFRLLLLEAGGLAGLAAGIGALLSLVLLFPLQRWGRVDFAPSWPRFSEVVWLFLLAVSLGGLTAFVSAMYPAFRASWREPYVAIQSRE